MVKNQSMRTTFLKFMIPLSFMLFTIFTPAPAGAVAIDPVLQTFSQPDGIKFQGTILGDEYIQFYETADGYTILQNSKKQWCYAQLDTSGKLSASKNIVGKISPQRAVKTKHLRPSPVVMENLLSKRRENEKAFQALSPLLNAPPGDGISPGEAEPFTYRLAVLLIDFPDMPSTFAPDKFQNLLLSEGFTYTSPVPGEPAYGSMNDYYQTISYGQFKITGQVFPWVRANHPKAHYATGGGNISTEAVAKSGVNLDDFDGYAVIYAGTVGASSGDLWPRTFSAGKLHYIMSEKWLPVYEFSPIGTHCHEFGHLLGLPDLYDTDHSSPGVGYWDLMGTGNYGGGFHERPFQLSVWSKKQLGWVNPQVLYKAANPSITLSPIENSPTAIGLVSKTSSFLLENRQKINYDLRLPAGGLLIWHADDRFGVQSQDDHRILDLEEANGIESGGAFGHPFPGSSGNTEFNGASTPSSKDYDGFSYVSVSDIAVSGQDVTFNVSIDLGGGGGITVNDEGNFPNLFTAIEVANDISGTVQIPAGNFSDTHLKPKRGAKITGINPAESILSANEPGTIIFDIRNTHGIEISNLTMTAAQDKQGIHVYKSPGCIIHHNIFRDLSEGISIYNCDTLIHNNTILNTLNSGINCLGACSANIRNNTITHSGGGIAAVPGHQATLGYNNLWANTVNYQGILPGPGSTQTDPLFVNFPAGDFHLRPDSPLIDAGDPDPAFNDPGGSRNDMGALPLEQEIVSPPGWLSLGWNMVSIPNVPADPAVETVFADLIAVGNVLNNNLQRYNAQSGLYENYPSDFSTLEKGRAYWLKVANPRDISYWGYPDQGEQTLPLHGPAWNMIGHPFDQSDLLMETKFSQGGNEKSFNDAVQTGWVDRILYFFDPAVQQYKNLTADGTGQDDSLRSWRGYWLLAFEPNLDFSVNVGNLPPIAVAYATPTGGYSPLAVLFTSNSSYDPDGEIVSYHWDFGNGDSSGEPNHLYTYQADGQYTATLTVTDEIGSSASDDLVIRVGRNFTQTLEVAGHGESLSPDRSSVILDIPALPDGPWLNEMKDKSPDKKAGQKKSRSRKR